MTDHDELLARADWVLNATEQERIDARVDIEDVIADLAEALRAALAARPQDIRLPDMAGEENEWFARWLSAEADLKRLRAAARDVITEWDAGGEWIRGQFESALDAMRPMAVAGSATPTHRDEAGNEWITPAEDMWQDDDVAPAGSATPTDKPQMMQSKWPASAGNRTMAMEDVAGSATPAGDNDD